MDGFSYHNIFETKGIEYIAIIMFLLLLIPFWIVLNRQVKVTKQMQKALGILTAGILRIPQGIFHSKNHTWTHLERSGIAKVGLDDLILHLTGEVKFSFLRQKDELVNKGELLAEIVHQDKVLRIYSPIAGQILETNALLNESAEILNDDPFGKGWMYKMKPTNWIGDTSAYYLAEEATKWTTTELDRFKDFLAGSMKVHTTDSTQVVLQDGGELMDNTLAELPVEVWQDFQKDFLNYKE